MAEYKKKIKRRTKKGGYNMNKKGSIMDLAIFMIIAFVIVVFFGLWVYGFNQITETLGEMNQSLGIINTTISEISADTFGRVNTAQTTWLHILAFVMIFSMALSILLHNFLVKAHPVFFILYVFVTIGVFMASVYISNYYEELLTNPVFGSTLLAFRGATFIMLNLPIWIAIIGIFGAVLLFAGILRDAGTGGGVG